MSQMTDVPICSSEVSDSLVLTNVHFSDEDVKSLSSKSENGDHTHAMGFETESESEMGSEIGSDVQPVTPITVKKGNKRDLMKMLCHSSNLDMDNLPDSIMLINDIKEIAKKHITPYLPAKSLLKFKMVSKEWNNWISSPFFGVTQSKYFRKTSGFFQDLIPHQTSIRFFSLDHSAYGVPYPFLGFLPVQVSIKSSCNGLLLCQDCNDENQFYICNPANTQWTKLPYLEYHGVNRKLMLGFEPSSLNFEPCYHVLFMLSPHEIDTPVMQFVMYDSITKSWRQSDTLCTDLDASVVKSEGIFINGVVYLDTTSGELLAFDVKNEIYTVQKLPVEEVEGALTYFLGEICYVIAGYDDASRSCVLDVYSCSSISLTRINIPVDDVEDGGLVESKVLGNSCDDVVALVVTVSQAQKRLYVYHVKEETVECLKVFKHLAKLFPYVNSLVPLNA